MNTVAVIPARAGSKGIPNKNIRLVGGHPLVYYAIHNALSSVNVSHVVVTTDSDAVRIIAQQMGAEVHWRDAALCADDVTLDAVIADAVPSDVDWDYVVTMQPTSPTLSVKTLDAAIGKAVEEGLDTLISVVNEPRLSWGKNEDGSVHPNYAARLNRQWLPADYAETGAFVVSRASVVTPETRIGEKVGVFEVPASEGIDIDTFDDLRCVAAHLDREKVAIYVNGNNKRGIGHIYRALEMADEFYTKPDIYYDVNQTDPKVFGGTTHNLIGVDGIADLFDRCKGKRYTLFINDILTTSIDYMIGLRSVVPEAKIVNFEDDGEGILKADLVFNALYHDDELPQVRAGGGDTTYRRRHSSSTTPSRLSPRSSACSSLSAAPTPRTTPTGCSLSSRAIPSATPGTTSPSCLAGRSSMFPSSSRTTSGSITWTSSTTWRTCPRS